jgi:hypothetical protein
MPKTISQLSPALFVAFNTSLAAKNPDSNTINKITLSQIASIAGNVFSDNVNNITSISLSDYNEISPKDPKTLYIIDSERTIYLGSTQISFKYGNNDLKMYVGDIQVYPPLPTTTTTTLPPLPGKPIINSATFFEDDNFTLIIFSAPENDGGSEILTYIFYFDDVIVEADELFLGNSASAIFNQNLLDQNVQVSAVTSNGEGLKSDPITVELAPATLYFTNSVSAQWNSVGNWWLDEQNTQAAGRLPNVRDSVIAFGTIEATGETVVNFTLVGAFGGSLNVTGIATFNNSSFNAGFITGNAIFNDSSENFGDVSGTATFNDNACNAGTAGTFIPDPPPEC